MSDRADELLRAVIALDDRRPPKGCGYHLWNASRNTLLHQVRAYLSENQPINDAGGDVAQLGRALDGEDAGSNPAVDRSASPHQPIAATPSSGAGAEDGNGPSQEGADGSAATRIQQTAQPVAWMYECESHRHAGDPPTVTTKRWSAPHGNWTETPLYAAVQPIPLTDEQIINATYRADEETHGVTRVSEKRPDGWHATTIFDGDKALFEFARNLHDAFTKSSGGE